MLFVAELSERVSCNVLRTVRTGGALKSSHDLNTGSALLSVNVVSETLFTIHGHGVASAVQDLLARLRSLEQVDLRVNSLRRADVVHVHTLGPWSLAILATSRGNRIVTAHVDAASLAGSIAGAALLEGCINRYLGWFLSKADTVVALNNAQASMLAHLIPAGRIVVLGNGLPSASPECAKSREQARLELQLHPDRRIVLAIGQLQPRKGVEEFLLAAKEVPEADFVWVGAWPFGPLTAQYFRMRRLVARAYPNVRFVGQASRSRVMEYLAAADVFFHPSEYENDSIAVIEAIHSGLPLVLRDLPSYQYPIRDFALLGDSRSFPAMLRRQLSDEGARARARQLAEVIVRKAGEEERALLQIYGLDLS